VNNSRNSSEQELHEPYLVFSMHEGWPCSQVARLDGIVLETFTNYTVIGIASLVPRPSRPSVCRLQY